MDMRMKTGSGVSTSSRDRTLLLLEVISVLGEDRWEVLIMAKSSVYVNVCQIRAVMLQA